MRGKFGEKLMADLPKDFINEAWSFLYEEVDHFGPFLVKERLRELKRYGASFLYWTRDYNGNRFICNNT